MDEADAFFTHTIVGAPYTVLLGRRLSPVETINEGIAVHLPSGKERLSQAWQEWVVLSHACDPVGRPRLRPARFRAFLERFALVIAVAGLLGLVASAAYWGMLSWK